MLMKVFSVRGMKAEAFLQPFFMVTKGTAIRAFTALVNDDKHHFGKHPEDFTLFELGEWDDCNNSWEMMASPHSIGVGVEFKRQGL